MELCLDDGILLQQIRNGSAAAFNTLCERYWKKVYLSAFKRLKDHDQAEDITQDIFANLWLKKEQLSIGNIGGYLHIAVRNRVLNLFEKEKKYIPFEHLLYETVNPADDQADAVALRNEFLKAYNALVDAMPAQRKTIFQYYYDQGFSTDEIALQLAVSRKTVQNQLGRAVSFLKANLSHLLFLLILFWVS
jgi:RNA polymerase sigma-70 factor (ECF subfamily)